MRIWDMFRTTESPKCLLFVVNDWLVSETLSLEYEMKWNFITSSVVLNSGLSESVKWVSALRFIKRQETSRFNTDQSLSLLNIQILMCVSISKICTSWIQTYSSEMLAYQQIKSLLNLCTYDRKYSDYFSWFVIQVTLNRNYEVITGVHGTFPHIP